MQFCERDRGEEIIPTFKDNLHQLKTKVEAIIARGQVPIIFLDLDDTLNRRFGAPIEEKAVTSLRNLYDMPLKEVAPSVWEACVRCKVD